MPKIPDPWDHHDWNSRRYVSQWAERQDGREADRAEAFRLIRRLAVFAQLRKYATIAGRVRRYTKNEGGKRKDEIEKQEPRLA